MQTIVKSWIKYILVIVMFGVCSNLIYLSLPIYMMVVYDRVLFSFSMATLTTMIVGVLISLFVMGLIEYFRTRMIGQFGNILAQRVAPSMLKSMHKDGAGINRQGYIRGPEDLERVRNTIVQGQFFSFLDLPWILIFLGILFFIHPLIGGVATAAVFMAAFFQVLLGVLEKRRYTVADVAFQANTDFARICLQHAEIVAGMGMLPRIRERYLERYFKVLALHAEADALHSGIGSVIRFLHLTALVAVFGSGVIVFFSDKITTGAIFAAVMISARIFYPFERSLVDMKATIEALASYKRLQHFVSLDEKNSKLSLPKPKGKFEAESLSLALNGKAVVHNISFVLQPGETLGIVGPSASGKTSLCKILLGIWPAVAGKVRLDGAEIGQWPEDELRQYTGYMPQEPELFPVSVAENIARLMAVDSEKVVKAAQKAGAHEMILKLPQGYDTKIDQTGKNLAAGQRQLISLARALYGDPKLVILDEPHSLLDDQGNNMVLHALNILKQENITTLVVSDRSNLLVNLDKLLVINDGQMVLYGPSKEVINQLANRQQPQQAAGV
jgi:ATP-binding cassette, subfamily C, bacterial EexD